MLGGQPVRLASFVGILKQDGAWSEDREEVERAMIAAAGVREVCPVSEESRRRAIRLLSPTIRSYLGLAASRRWAYPEPDATARCVARRLRQASHRAARARDLGALERLERALEFVSGGHTAGESLLVRQLLEMGPRELTRAVAQLPAATPRPEEIDARLTGVVLFEDDVGPTAAIGA
jgi:hypothetical protein